MPRCLRRNSGESVTREVQGPEGITKYKEYADRSHYLIGADGWEEIADYALDWAASHARTATPA
jgi:hypothetical protein